MSGVIQDIVVTCIEQEDATGSDTLDFYLDDVFVGTKDLSTGQTLTLGGNVFNDTLYVNDNSNLTIKERDFPDPSDLLLDHTFTASEISSGSLKLSDQHPNAQYEFEIHVGPLP
jgi:hypothetical protein